MHRRVSQINRGLGFDEMNVGNAVLFIKPSTRKYTNGSLCHVFPQLIFLFINTFEIDFRNCPKR